jgi:CHAD domain-containing protein
MGYCFVDHETVQSGVKRIAFEQLDKAVELTKPEVKEQDEAIHGARVSLKNLRALLRLARAKHNDDIFAHENTYYRDTSRRLSEVRDTTAMISAFDTLTEHYVDQLTSNAFTELRKSFIRTRRKQQSDKDEALADLARMLDSARSRVNDWPNDDNDFSALRQGLKRIYKNGSRSMAQAQAKPSIENFHKWRKRVKDLGYQMRLLKPIWPKMQEDLADELERLADYLSDDHDLAILCQTVVQRPPEDLVALIDQRRGELEVKAGRLGKRMYVDKPNAFVRRLEVHWRAWCAETTVDSTANQLTIAVPRGDRIHG